LVFPSPFFTGGLRTPPQFRQVDVDQMRQRSRRVPERRDLVEGESVATKGRDLPELRARVGMLFQSLELFPHLSILANLTLALEKVLGRSHDEAVVKPRGPLDRVGLGGYSKRLKFSSYIGMRNFF
jgi:ABC-type histidine transport system ATPase subunit